VGTSLGETSTNSWSPLLQPSGHLIQVDIDAAQIGKNYHVDFGLVGPAHFVLAGLARRLRRRPTPAAEVSGVRHYEGEALLQDTTPLRHARAVQLLQEVAPEDTIFTCDIGEHTIFAVHYLQVDRPEGFILHSGLASLGSGIGAAVGAKVAQPDA